MNISWRIARECTLGFPKHYPKN